MLKKSIFFVFIFSVLILNVYSGWTDRIDKSSAFSRPDEFNPKSNLIKVYGNSTIIFEGAKNYGAMDIGAEIPITGLTGFYDYQTNGECQHHIYRVSSNQMHAVFMLSEDSANQSTSRRSKYSYSTDDGNTWTDLGEVPSGIRSGFATLSSYPNGIAVVCNHFINPPNTYLSGDLNYDLLPGLGNFTSVNAPYNYIWPGVSRLANGNFLVAGECYIGAAATDTAAWSVFNSTSHTFGPMIRQYCSTSLLNQRWTYGAGPSGQAFYVFDAISDVGGNFGLNRMFISMSSDNGVTWSSPTVFFNPSIVGSDTLVPFFGLDGIYDAAGNYYVAFNTHDPEGDFHSAKMWVSKNGGTPVLVAQHGAWNPNGVPSDSLVAHADAGIIGIDHPSLSISSDGNWIFVGFSVQYQDDTLNGYNKCHMWYSYSPTSTLNFVQPVQVTNSGLGSYDERYCSLAQTSPLSGANPTVYFTYQKDPQPGSSAFNDNAPITRASMILRKITNANQPFGIRPISDVAKDFRLYQNFPNPFNPTTMIQFDLRNTSYVTLKVYNSIGQVVATLLNNELVSTGSKQIQFDANYFASGVYFYTLSAFDSKSGARVFNDSKKMILVK